MGFTLANTFRQVFAEFIYANVDFESYYEINFLQFAIDNTMVTVATYTDTVEICMENLNPF